ncbi:MAG: DUF433 domain-containing protein [Bacteroidota bacterium]
MENIFERIAIDEKVCNGKPTIQGKRIAVQSILEFLAAGDSAQEIIKNYPILVAEDITACIKFAAELMNKNYTIKSVA